MHEQDMAILQSLVAVAWADGRVTPEEQQVIEALLQAFEASPQETQRVREYAREPKTIEDVPLTDMDRDDRRVLLQHAVLLTFVDGKQEETERALLNTLANRLRIDPSEREVLIDSAAERAKRFLHLL